MANTGEMFQDIGFWFRDYVHRFGSERVIEAVPAFGENISTVYLHSHSVVDYIVQKQARQEATLRAEEAQRRSVDAWKRALETPVKPRKALN